MLCKGGRQLLCDFPVPIILPRLRKEAFRGTGGRDVADNLQSYFKILKLLLYCFK